MPFYLKDSEKAVPDEVMAVTIGQIYTEVVRIGIAACIENRSTKLRSGMLDDYAKSNNIPATLLHTCKRWLCEKYTFQHHHLTPTEVECNRVMFGENEIRIFEVTIDGIYYDSIVIPCYSHLARLFQANSPPKIVNYDNFFLK